MAAISSPVWGGTPYEITQEVNVPGFKPEWYQYSKDLGFPAGYHVGLDIGVPRGTPIRAAVSGKVIQEGFSDSFRPYPVWIESDDNPATATNEKGFVAIYAHLMSENVAPGQHVKAGDIIGLSGEQTYRGTDTPDGSGPHLHMELRVPDNSTGSGYRTVDPRGYISGSETPGGNTNFLPSIGDVISGDALDNFKRDMTVLIQRAFLVGLGLIFLYFGVAGLVRTHTGFRLPTGKGLAKTLPVGRAASVVM